jgi:hypothetical protein
MAHDVRNRGERTDNYAYECCSDGGVVGYYEVSAAVLIDAAGVKCLIGIVWFVVPLLFDSCFGQWNGQLARCC